MIRYRSIAVLMVALALPEAALAQHQPVVVPAEASVVIPARGAAPLGQPPAVRRVRRSYSLPVAPPQPDVSPLLVALPLGAAAALLAATLSSGNGGGGGVSAPSRTR
jgi:hypothetical protein